MTNKSYPWLNQEQIQAEEYKLAHIEAGRPEQTLKPKEYSSQLLFTFQYNILSVAEA